MVKIVKDDTTEARILTAARKVFMEKGMDGARMQDIADEAGINKAMLHYYFRSKEKLFEKIFREVAANFLPRIILIFGSEDSLFTKIECFVDAYIVQMKQTPYLPIFFLNEVNRQPEAFIKKMFGSRKPPVHQFYAQVKNEVKKGIIRPVEPGQLLMNIFSLTVFPFAARPIFQVIGDMDQKKFDLLLEQRRKDVPRFIIDAIRK
jgi:AcrR family transcriptional regulator